MHPAPSIIIFTVLSGLGFGLLFWLGLGIPDVEGWDALGIYLVAFSSSIIGLLASTFHLGNPQRAWRAFTQWRTSWLSREGWFAMLALIFIGSYAILVIFFENRMAVLGFIGSVLCLITVFATSMIYAQMKTIPRWNHWSTCVLFIALSMAGGAILSGQLWPGFVLLILVGATQLFVWTKGDSRFSERGSTIETATQLGHIGKVKLFEPPHTGSNYLLKEMAFQVARKHALKLRKISFALMCIVPAIIILLLPGNWFFITAAALLHIGGTLISRWLFFAEAEHVVGLYYGKH